MSEQEMHGCLQGASSSYSVDAALAAAKGCGDLSEAGCRAAVVDGWLAQLRTVAELKGFDAGLHRSFAEEVEALEEGEVVLNVARSAELIAAGIAVVYVLGGAGRAGGAGWRYFEG